MKRLASVVAFSLLLGATRLVAAEYGTAEEAKAMLERAVAAVNADEPKALAEFSKGEAGFKDRDLYVFCYGPDGKSMLIRTMTGLARISKASRTRPASHLAKKSPGWHNRVSSTK